ncbi:TerB family tellurite resistance protein [Mucilaginibacter terrae]|nr:TerB family tellurite resistance protein [Mucilaginibacter terrae]
MKKVMFMTLFIAAMTVTNASRLKAQSVADVIKELMLDYQKLANMKNTLTHMYDGYGILNRGYNAVKGVSMENFSLHKAFLDAELLVSPAVRAYPRTGDIIRNQSDLLKEYRSVKRRSGSSDLLSYQEKRFSEQVYDKLTQASSDNIDELARVTTDSKLRMTDAERLAAIDRLFLQSQDQLSYLRKFNEQIIKTIRQRQAADSERAALRTLYGIK